MEEIMLSDIPDLSTFEDTTKPEPFVDGWYRGTILEQRQFTDANGNDRIFTSNDEPSQKGDSRNIRLQVVLKRQEDGRELNTSVLVNYRPEDLTQDTVQAVTQQMEKNKDGDQWGPLFRPFMTIQRLSTLQKVAGVRQLQRNGNGGLNLHTLFGKTLYARIAPDDRNPQYKAVVEFRDQKPKRAPVL
jgi:hypothetical protein